MVNKWVEMPLCDLFDFSGGYSASRADLSKKGYPYLHYGDIHGSARTFVDVCSDGTIPRLDVNLNKISDTSLLCDGDIVFVDASEDDEGASRHIVVRNATNAPFISGLHTIIAKARTGNLDKKFREFCFQTACIKEQFKFYAVGTKVIGVNKSTIGKILLSFPESQIEQRRIAEALSDIDSLIEALKKVIAKKRAIKQGAMQELLTGKRRLPCFNEEWIKKPLNELIIDKPTYGINEPASAYAMGLPQYIRITDITEEGKYSKENVVFVNHSNASNYRLQNNDIVLARTGASVGKSYLYNKQDGTLVYAGFLIKISIDPQKANSKYIYECLHTKSYWNWVQMISMRSGQPGINSEQYASFEILLPPLSEQCHIAAVASDMDAEIDALSERVSKLYNLKQGMMSELLTGSIRLMEDNSSKTISERKIIQLTEHKSKVSTIKRGGHNQQFDDAVMISGIVDILYSDKYPLGRKKVQKCLYLLRRHQDESVAAFKKKAAGPYADEVRYKGGEPIAKRAGYIITTATKGRGTAFARGGKISQSLDYIKDWGRQSDINWVAKNLKFKKVGELELLATVDMAICDLMAAGTPVSLAAIKRLIATNKEWNAKLQKQAFADANIDYAIRELKMLLY